MRDLLRGLIAQITHSVFITCSPGATIRINQNGLNYVKQIGLEVMNAELSGLTIPDIHGRKASLPNARVGGIKSVVSYDLTDIKIAKFTAPLDQSTIAVNTDRNLVWTVRS